jgi:glucokinase
VHDGKGRRSAVMVTLGTGVGGGMSRAGSIVTDAVTGYYRKYAFHVSTATPIVLAELGNDAGIYGCAKMVLSA